MDSFIKKLVSRRQINRRQFLKLCLSGYSLLAFSKFLGNEEIEKILTEKGRRFLKKSKVAVIKGMNLTKMTSSALEEIGSMRSIVKPGQSVFIKPNYITGGLMDHDPVTGGEIPHPDVVIETCAQCLKAGAKEVVVGEWVERPPKIEFGGHGEGAQIRERVELLNKKYGHRISLVNLSDVTKKIVYFPSDSALSFLGYPDVVIKSDVKISVAVLKTHHTPSPVTLGMKNFMGVMPSVLYGEPRQKLHRAGIHQVIVDINKALRPDVVIISGAFGLEGEGVSLFLGGKTVDVSQRLGGYLVVAGKDPVATDATATRIITKNWKPVPEDADLGTPWYVHHLRLAYLQGLGKIRSSEIDIVGERVNDVAMSWQMPLNNPYPELPAKYSFAG